MFISQVQQQQKYFFLDNFLLGCIRILVLELELVGRAKFHSLRLVVVAVLLSELELLELSRPKCKNSPEAVERKWWVQILRPLWTVLLAVMNTCDNHQLGKHQKKQHLELIAVTFLVSSSKTLKAKVLFKQTTRIGVETPFHFLLTLAMISGSLRMLNLLTVLSVRLLARGPTVLTVPVIELELVFERTLSLRKLIVIMVI